MLHTVQAGGANRESRTRNINKEPPRGLNQYAQTSLVIYKGDECQSRVEIEESIRLRSPVVQPDRSTPGTLLAS